jgi:anti-sigma B factor antagonist
VTMTAEPARDGADGCSLRLIRDLDQQITVVEVAGEVDLANAHQLSEVVDAATSGPHRIVIVDLTQLSFMDSTGLSAVVRSQKHATTLGVRIAVVANTRRIRDLFAITGLDALIPVVATRSEAVLAATAPEA